MSHPQGDNPDGRGSESAANVSVLPATPGGMARKLKLPWEAGDGKDLLKKKSGSSLIKKTTETIARRACRLGYPGAFLGPASSTLFGPDYWLNQLAIGHTRLQYELETIKGADPGSGYTGFFAPRFTERDAGQGAIRMDDVPFRAPLREPRSQPLPKTTRRIPQTS